MDKKNLIRIREILSARKGAEFPKLQWGGVANYTMRNPRQGLIYSKDNTNWFKDPMMTVPYIGSLDGFSSIGPQYADFMRIPGSLEITPNSAIENSAGITQAIWQNQAKIQAEQAAAQTVASATNPETVSINGQHQSDETGKKDRNGNTKLEDPERATKHEERKEKWANAVGAGSTELLQGVGTAVGAAQKATDSDTTKMIDTAYSATAEGIKQAGPIGQVVGTAMQMGQAAGDIIQSLGGGTDQQTTTDKWMDSALFSWNIGMLNGFAGENTQDFGADQSIISQVGGSYGDSVNAISEAASKAGKKYGLFSAKDRKKTDAAINLARSQQNAMGNIADTAATQRLAVQSMGEQAGLAYSMMTSGGYDQKYTYAAKQGGSLEWNPVIELDWEPTVEWEPQIELNWELPTFKEGGNIDINEELEWIPELSKGNPINLGNVKNYYQNYDLSGVEFIESDSPRTEGNKLYIRNEEDAIHELWHYLFQNKPNEAYREFYDNLTDDKIIQLGGDLNFVKRFEGDPGHFYHPAELEARIHAAKYSTKGQSYTKEFFQELRKNPDKYGNNMRDLLYMFNDENLVKLFNIKTYKSGGSLGDSDVPETEETAQKNVIPEGALHKNKHHMEHAEGWTKKGIPVIDDDGEQQAEIEHSEIIFTLEVTKKLEEYYKTFYSDESSNKEKEQAALDTGKLLVYQILENTEDRTGLIDSCKKGGTLTLKKTTDDLIEEALEDVSAVVIVEEKEIIKTPKKKEEKSDKELMKEVIKEALIELLIK